MRRGAKQVATNSAKLGPGPAKGPKLKRDQIERIRERRKNIEQREGVFSDSALLIRDERDR